MYEEAKLYCFVLSFPEPNLRLSAAQVQKQLRLAKALGCADLVLPVLLQELLGRGCAGQFTLAGIYGRATGHSGCRTEGVRLQAVLQEPHVLLPGGKRTHLPAVSSAAYLKLSSVTHKLLIHRWLEVLRSATQMQDLKLSAGNGNHHTSNNNNNNGNGNASTGGQ